jgi:PEGA domain
MSFNNRRRNPNMFVFMLRLMKNVLVCLIVVLLTSCATMSRGSHETLTVLSEPSRANVVLSSGEKGVTPATFVKRRRGNFTVTVSKTGYVSKVVNVESKASATAGTARARDVLLGGPLGVTVDAVSGAYNSLYPNPVSVRLLPRRKSATATTERRDGTSRTTTSSLPPSKLKPTSAPSSPTVPTFPTAEPVQGKPGFVISPFDPKQRYVDVSGYPSGSKAKDPWTDKIFIVP